MGSVPSGLKLDVLLITYATPDHRRRHHPFVIGPGGLTTAETIWNILIQRSIGDLYAPYR